MRRRPLPRTFTDPVLRDRPVGLWLIEGENPVRCRDLVGDADASMTGTVSHGAQGPGGRDSGFFVPENRFAIPPRPAFNPTTAITLEFWILFATTANRQVWNKVSDSFYLRVINGQIGVFLNGVSPGWDYTTSAGPAKNGQIHDSRWHHVAAAWSQASGKLRLYVDGVLDSELARTGTLTTGPNGMNVGYRGDEVVGSRGLDGFLAMLALYDRALDPAELRAHWEAGDRPGAIY